MDSLEPAVGYDSLTVTPCSPHIGAEIGNIDLTRPLTDTEAGELRRAFTRHLVLFFRDQRIGFDDHIRLAECFGPIGYHFGGKTASRSTDDPRVRKFHADENTARVSGDVWHTDQSCASVPPMASILYIHTIPPRGGGDTIFASMYRAYEALSDRMKAYLDGLTALHDGRDVFGEGTPSAVHPVVARHPDSGRPLLFVNGAFTKRIVELPEQESDAVLSFLCTHCARAEWSFRFRWQPHSIAMWDNRCAQHFAVSDYLPGIRSGYRVQIDGVAPPVAA